MAKMAVAKAPDSLDTLALGSCLGIVLYDAKAKVAGLSHAMLPEIALAKAASRDNIAKFVDTAICALLDDLVRHGGNRRCVQAKIAGGANMFPDIVSSGITIGERNVESARDVLGGLDIQIVAEDVGGSAGRTIIFNIEESELTVKTLRFGVKII